MFVYFDWNCAGTICEWSSIINFLLYSDTSQERRFLIFRIQRKLKRSFKTAHIDQMWKKPTTLQTKADQIKLISSTVNWLALMLLCGQLITTWFNGSIWYLFEVVIILIILLLSHSHHYNVLNWHLV